MHNPISILVVDDDRSMAELACSILEIENFKTVYAKNGEEALDILKKESFDLVLTDLDMPKVNGLQLRTFILYMYPSVKVVLMTGGSHKGIKLPPDIDFLEKPFDMEKLLTRVRKELGNEKTGEDKS